MYACGWGKEATVGERERRKKERMGQRERETRRKGI